jgi:molybdopterin/thiamine biosynthesis adenylyltransferase
MTEQEKSLTADVIARTALRARHADTLGDSLMSLDALHAPVVELSISALSARTLAGQQLLVHVANLLGRLEGVIDTIEVSIDGGDVTLRAGVDPRQPGGDASLRAATEAAATLAAPHRIRPGRGDCARTAVIGVHVGARQAPHYRTASRAGTRIGDVWAAASDWLAFVGRTPGPDCSSEAELPFGAHAAASLAAAEVFRLIRATGELVTGPNHLVLSTWSWTLGDDRVERGPTARELLTENPNGVPPFTLAGAGAVGSAFLLALWATGLPVRQATAVDGDVVSRTNLNRYILFGTEDLGMAKSVRAATILGREGSAPFLVRAEQGWWADHRRCDAAPIRLLVSAVDKNVVRHQLQDALPRVILGASTHGLRVQADRYELADVRSPCLKCHNPKEPLEADATMRARLVDLDDDALRAEAEDRGVDIDRLLRYTAELRKGEAGCGIVTGDDLAKLRHGENEPTFAVSFVSAFAGTMLAAQVAREASDVGTALLPGRSRGNFQLWRPGARANAVRAVSPQAGCWCENSIVREAYDQMWRRFA